MPELTWTPINDYPGDQRADIPGTPYWAEIGTEIGTENVPPTWWSMTIIDSAGEVESWFLASESDAKAWVTEWANENVPPVTTVTPRVILPNDRVGATTVVASCYYGGTTGEGETFTEHEWNLALLLHPESPYFEVAILDAGRIRSSSGRLVRFEDAYRTFCVWGYE